MDDPLAILQQKAAAQKGKALPEEPEPPPQQLPSDKHALCLQILTEGYVQSFVDFFYLTHKPEAVADAAEEDDDPSSSRRMLPDEQLEFVRSSLCNAEAARRQSRTKEVYGSYQSLAELFASMDDFKTSVYFREKCLEIAKLVADTEGELRASRELGVAHDKLGNVQESIKFYEKAHALAQGDQANSEQTSRDVVHVSRTPAPRGGRRCHAR
jgi:tetratricopeptide (TPR) repeat protein